MIARAPSGPHEAAYGLEAEAGTVRTSSGNVFSPCCTGLRFSNNSALPLLSTSFFQALMDADRS